jgi:hypothetical protein
MVRRSKTQRDNKVLTDSKTTIQNPNPPPAIKSSGMFAPSNSNPSGAKAGSFIEAPVSQVLISKYLEEFSHSDETSMAVLGAILYTLADMSTDPGILGINCAAMFKSGAAADFMVLADQPVATAGSPTKEDDIRSLIKSNLASATQWICDLVNASKKKDLTGANVEGLFAAYGGASIKGSEIARFINSASDFLPDMINDVNFRKGLTNNKWTSYQVSRVSTGSILLKISNDFINLNIFEDGGAIHRAITDSAESPHNIALADLIPGRIIGYGAIFLDSCGTPIDKWYQGNKHRGELPNAKVAGIKVIFRKYLELNSAIAKLDDQKDVAGLLSVVPASYW